MYRVKQRNRDEYAKHDRGTHRRRTAQHVRPVGARPDVMAYAPDVEQHGTHDEPEDEVSP